MMITSALRRALSKARGEITSIKHLSSAAGALADVCNLNIVSSPFPPIMDSSHYKPVPEFVSADWENAKWTNKVAVRDGNTGETRTFSDYNIYM
jgi:hypothetical protein